MRGPWTSGGIEFNFGIIGHHPGTGTPADYRLEKQLDGSLMCTVGGIDLPSRTQWRVKIILKVYFLKLVIILLFFENCLKSYKYLCANKSI